MDGYGISDGANIKYTISDIQVLGGKFKILGRAKIQNSKFQIGWFGVAIFVI
jgi:hypothetical protein